MKNLLHIFTMLFSTAMFSSPSYAEWTRVGKNVDGNTYYVNFEEIKEQGGYVYWWSLLDLTNPINGKYLSHEVFTQGDCVLSRYLTLRSHLYKEPMGRGNKDTSRPPKEWRYPTPNSVNKIILKSVCS